MRIQNAVLLADLSARHKSSPVSGCKTHIWKGKKMLCVMGKGYEGMGLGCRKRGLGQAPGKPFSEQGLVRLPMGSFAV